MFDGGEVEVYFAIKGSQWSSIQSCEVILERKV